MRLMLGLVMLAGCGSVMAPDDDADATVDAEANDVDDDGGSVDDDADELEPRA